MNGVTQAGAAAFLPRYVPTGLDFFLLVPRPLDRSAVFARRHLALLGKDIPPGFERVHFSRIVLSADGSHAFFQRAVMCGNLCGSGASAVWRRERGRWVLEKIESEWIS